MLKAKHKFCLVPACLLMILIFSCRKNKQSQSNLLESMGEGEKLAKTLYGEDSVVLAKGDLNGNGLPYLLTGIVSKKENEKRYWIKKGGVLEKNDSWETILNFDTKLSSVKGNIVNMIDANNGYIISFDPNETPMNIIISIADSSGNSISDEALIKWSEKEKIYEFFPSPDMIEDNAL